MNWKIILAFSLAFIFGVVVGFFVEKVVHQSPSSKMSSTMVDTMSIQQKIANSDSNSDSMINIPAKPFAGYEINENCVYLPEGATISAISSGNLATVSWKGLPDVVCLRQYAYTGSNDLVPENNTVKINLSKSNRFQLLISVKNLLYYLYLTPEMKDIVMRQLNNIEINSDNSNGCCLAVKKE